MAIPINSAESIIRLAMEDAGLLQEGSDPSSEQFVKFLGRLNHLINLWQTQGLKLWLQSDQEVVLQAGKSTYSLKPGGDVNITKPLRVLQAYYVEASATSRRPLDPPLSRDEYTRLSNVTQQGALTSYFVDKLQSQLDVVFWMTPDAQAASGAAHLIIQQQLPNLVSLTDLIGFPPEWGMPLHWGLADDICTGQPQAVIDRCSARATQFREALEAWDVEDASTSFQPDFRGLAPGAFR